MKSNGMAKKFRTLSLKVKKIQEDSNRNKALSDAARLSGKTSLFDTYFLDGKPIGDIKCVNLKSIKKKYERNARTLQEYAEILSFFETLEHANK